MLGLHLFAGYLGLHNRQQVGVRLFPYRRRHGARAVLRGGGGTEKGSAQVSVHQQWLTNTKKTRRVGAPKSKSVEAYKSKSTNSEDGEKDKTSGVGEYTS